MERTRRHARRQYEPRYSPDAPLTASPHEAEFPTTSNISASGNATIANAAGKIHVDRQTFEFARAANEVQVAARDDHSNQVTTTNNYFNHIYGYNQRKRTWSDNEAASFIQNRTNIIGPDDPYIFSDRSFRTFAECRERNEDNDRQFEEILPQVEELEMAVITFQEKVLKFEPRKRGKISSTYPSWAQQKSEIFQKMSEARKYCEYENRNLSEVGRFIHRIKEASATFFEWLDWFPNERCRCSIGEFIRCLITALTDGHDVYTIHLKSLTKTLELFVDSGDYIYLQRRRLLSADMIKDTVAIFVELAAVAIILLRSTLNQIREEQTQNSLSGRLGRLGNYLKEINRDAVNERRGRSVAQYIKDSDPFKLQILNQLLNLFDDMQCNARLEVAENKRLTEGRSAQYTQKAHRSTQVLKEQLDNSYQGPSISMILNELSFKSKENAADIEECLAGAEMNRKQRRQISSITKGEAFRGWLGEQSGSSTLIVYGNMEIDACISPISFLTSTIGKYCKERGFIVLSYFCGLHGESDSYDILRTMIGQLLSQAELMVGSSLTISRNEFKGIKRRSLRTLNSLFAGLIEQLSSHRIRVVCLINTISTFETSEKVRETKSILSSLCRVARSLHAGKRGHSRSEMILKLLISDGQTSGIAHRYVKEDEIIEILEDAEEASDDELGIASEDIDEATGSSISSDEDD